MAELEEALLSRLANYGGLSALVVARIYPMILPQKPTLPAVTYQRIDGERESGMTQEHGMAHPRMQVDCWAATYSAAKAVATQVRGALQRWSGTVAGVTVLDSFLESDRDLYEPGTGGQDIFRVSLDFLIWHRE